MHNSNKYCYKKKFKNKIIKLNKNKNNLIKIK